MAYTDLFFIRLAWVLTQMMTTSVFQFWCGKPVVTRYRVEVLVISQVFDSLVSKSQFKEKSNFVTYKQLVFLMKVLLKRFHLNCEIIGFRPEIYR